MEIHAIIRGEVQGVGFRYTAQAHARQLGIKGTVQNLADGSVELYAQGTQQQLDEFMEQLVGEDGPGEVKQVDKYVIAPTKTYRDFQILF